MSDKKNDNQIDDSVVSIAEIPKASSASTNSTTKNLSAKKHGSAKVSYDECF